MKKLDEKLKELQEDIPKFPQDLDDKVFQAYEKHHDVKKNKLPSFLIPTLTSVTAIIIIVFLVQKFVGGVFDPFDVNTDPTSDSNDTTSLPTVSHLNLIQVERTTTIVLWLSSRC